MDGVKEEVTEGDCTPWMDSDVVKQEPAWSMEEDSPDQPSAVYSTAQPIPDNTSGSLLSLKRGVCQHCSAAFVLVSSLELHLASVHGEPLPFPEWTMSFTHGRLSREGTDNVREYSADSAVDFAVKLEPAWSMEEDSPGQSSAIYSTVQPMSDNTSRSLLSLKRGRVCQHCSAAFVLVSSLELHLVSVHGEKLHMVLPGSSTPDRCDAGNCSNTDIDKEVDSHGIRRALKRKADDHDTDDSSNLTTHKVAPQSGGQVFMCDVCWECFTQASILKTHKMTHSSVKSFVCDVCSKSFTLAVHLKRHKRVHTGERHFKCPHCDSCFTHTNNLQMHIKAVHESAKPHVCDVCGAAFSKTYSLTVHRRIHTGEKPHVCSDCGKGFAQSNHLSQHRLTHTGEKPHVCSDCGKGFALSIHLAQHHLTHTGEKPHSCPHCPDAFRYLYQLRAHIQGEHQ